jgi:branched-chain amino acid transport system substrate-binding protein
MRMRGARRWRVAATLLVAAVAFAALAAASSTTTSAATKPIVIGWAYDSKGNMAPFDGPALAAARIHVQQINSRGGVNGRRIRIDTCDTNNNEPTRAKTCARNLLARGADIMFVTCDVDFATPVVQEAIIRGMLGIAPCIGSDQIVPKSFGKE